MLVRMEARPLATAIGEEGERFLCVSVQDRLLVVPDACKHRGGPLSKGKWCERTESITCPWHEIVNGPNDFAKRALPSVRVGKELVFIFEEGPDRK